MDEKTFKKNLLLLMFIEVIGFILYLSLILLIHVSLVAFYAPIILLLLLAMLADIPVHKKAKLEAKQNDKKNNKDKK